MSRSRWALAARQRCSECGAPVNWCDAIDLPIRVPAAVEDVEERERLHSAIAFCGAAADAWWCQSCGNWGVFTDDAVL